MGVLIDGLLDANAVLVYVLVFLLVFAEDALFFGFILPGETAAVLGGVAASQGHVQLWLMMVLVVAAAITGDSVGYEVGKHVGPSILEHRVLRNNQAQVDRAREFLSRRGGTAVFLGRFVAFFRAMMPALAGISRMPYKLFLPYNAAGGVVWGAGFVILGFVAGNSYATVAKTVGRDLALVVVLIAVVVFMVWRIRKRRKTAISTRQQVPTSIPRMRTDIDSGNGSTVLRGTVSKERSGQWHLQAHTRLRRLPQIHHWILWPAVIASVTLAAGLITTSVPAVTATDFKMVQVLNSNHAEALNVAAVVINAVFSPVGGVFILIMMFFILLMWCRSPVNAVAVVSVTVAGWLTSESFKFLVARPRPDTAALSELLIPEPSSYSFPSGHTALATSLAVALYLLFRGTRWQRITIIGGVIVALTVAVSRVYLGVHYPVDVVASFFTSAAGILFFSGLYNQYASRILDRLTWLRRFGPIPRSTGQ